MASPTVDELVRIITGRTRGHRRPVVAVDGPSGSGKSTLVESVLELLPDAAVARVDEMYEGWDGLAAAVPVLVRDVLVPWHQGDPARYRVWDWARRAPGDWREVGPGAVLVVDGVGSGSRACTPYLDLLVWVELPEPVRYERAIRRDGEVYGPHWDRWAAQERALYAAESTRERADVVVAP